MSDKQFLGIDKAAPAAKAVLTCVEVDPDTGARKIVRIENPSPEDIKRLMATSKNFRLRIE